MTSLDTIISLLTEAQALADLDQRPALAGSIRRVRGHARELQPLDPADARRAEQARTVTSFIVSLTPNPEESQ